MNNNYEVLKKTRNKKICFIVPVNIYLCPYLKKYISSFDCRCDIICWNRHGVEENADFYNIFAFGCKMDERVDKVQKTINFLKFKSYVEKVLKENNYNGIVVFSINTAILLQGILHKQFRGKYIIDIRDYTMEKNGFFFFIEERLVKNSAFAVISSEGYKNFLPVYDYILSHNDVEISETILKKFNNRKRSNDKLIISFIGFVRFHAQNKKVILRFKNDNRFLLRFIGKNAFSLKDFCWNNNIYKGNTELINIGAIPIDADWDLNFDIERKVEESKQMSIFDL